MKFALALIAVCIGAATFVATSPASGQAAGDAAPIYGIKIPPGYRGWKFISEAHEAGNLNSIGVLLGNDIAFKAFSAGTLPYPDGSMLAALHYKYVPSDENNAIFGQVQSFVPGDATNLQFMVKDSKKYASSGGWGFAHFTPDGKPGSEAAMKTCAPCHARASRDGVFSRYAP